MKKKNLLQLSDYQLDNKSSAKISGGGKYKIIDDCNGNFGYYIWDSETGECWDLLGNKMHTC